MEPPRLVEVSQAAVRSRRSKGGLPSKVEGEGVFREGELEISDSAGCDFIGQRAVGDGLKHCNGGAKGGLLVLEVEVGVDLI